MADFVDLRVNGLKETIDYFQLLAKDQFPFAHSNACNSMAFLVRDAEMVEMKTVFDRPKEQTIRNVKVIKGNKANPGAKVRFDQIYDGDEYMVAEVDGGTRAMKKSEKAFGHYYVPGPGAKFDNYGNMDGGQINQILSFFRQNVASRDSKRKASAMRSGVQYFKLEQKTNGLRPGIYQRVSRGETSNRAQRYMIARQIIKQNRGGKKQIKELDQRTKALLMRGILPVLYFVNKPPTYKPLFKYFEVANRVIDENWQRVMGAAVDFALKTAK